MYYIKKVHLQILGRSDNRFLDGRVIKTNKKVLMITFTPRRTLKKKRKDKYKKRVGKIKICS